jgi:hypothetical protein
VSPSRVMSFRPRYRIRCRSVHIFRAQPEPRAKAAIVNLERFLPLIKHLIDFPEKRHCERAYVQNRPRHGHQLDFTPEFA